MSRGPAPASTYACSPARRLGRVGEVDLPEGCVLVGLAVAAQERAPAAEVAGEVGVDDDQRAAVGDHAAVQSVQRVGDQGRLEHLLEPSAAPGTWRSGCAWRARRRRPAPRRGAQRWCRTHACAAERPGRSRRPGRNRFGSRCSRSSPRGGSGFERRALGARLARQPGEGDHRDSAVPGGDGRCRLSDIGDVRRSAELAGGGDSRLDVEMLHQVTGPRPGAVESQKKLSMSARVSPVSASAPRTTSWCSWWIEWWGSFRAGCS